MFCHINSLSSQSKCILEHDILDKSLKIDIWTSDAKKIKGMNILSIESFWGSKLRKFLVWILSALMTFYQYLSKRQVNQYSALLLLISSILWPLMNFFIVFPILTPILLFKSLHLIFEKFVWKVLNCSCKNFHNCSDWQTL